jgi:hypothetical protein
MMLGLAVGRLTAGKLQKSRTKTACATNFVRLNYLFGLATKIDEI